MSQVSCQLMQLSALLYTVRQEEKQRKRIFGSDNNDFVYQLHCQKMHDVLENFLESVSLLADIDLVVAHHWFYDHYDELNNYMNLYKRFRNQMARFPLWYCKLSKFLIDFKKQCIMDGPNYNERKKCIIKNMNQEQYKEFFEYKDEALCLKICRDTTFSDNE